eukprot:Gb_33757 [translate_table: standard]
MSSNDLTTLAIHCNNFCNRWQPSHNEQNFPIRSGIHWPHGPPIIQQWRLFFTGVISQGFQVLPSHNVYRPLSSTHSSKWHSTSFNNAPLQCFTGPAQRFLVDNILGFSCSQQYSPHGCTSSQQSFSHKQQNFSSENIDANHQQHVLAHY